jgi:hypothetical protein
MDALAPAEERGKAEPQIPDELAGELMSIAEDLGGLGATFQMVREVLDRDAIFKACAESNALAFLSTSLNQITGELRNFIGRNCEGGLSN